MQGVGISRAWVGITNAVMGITNAGSGYIECREWVYRVQNDALENR